MASEKLKKSYRLVLVTDLDWTLVDHDDAEHKALHAFNDLWKKEFANDSLLVYSTGRSHLLYEKLTKEAPLMTPDLLVCSVGTEIFYEGTGATIDKEWQGILDEGWSNQQVKDIAKKYPELKPQPDSEQRPHKVSYHLQVQGEDAAKVLQKLTQDLQAAGLRTKVVYSGGVDVDVLPEKASKGKALEYILTKLPQPSEGVQVNGDSGNDVELFAVDGVRGCMVVNAHTELKDWCTQHAASRNIFQASQRCAGAIVEGLKHWGSTK